MISKSAYSDSLLWGFLIEPPRSEWSWFRVAGGISLSSPQRPYRLWGPPSFLFNGYLGVKRPGREVNHSPSASAEVQNKWSYTSAPPICFQGVDGENSIYTFYQAFCVFSSLPRPQCVPPWFSQSNNIRRWTRNMQVLMYSVFHTECPNFKTLYFCNHEPQMNETCTTWTAVA